MGQGSSSRQVGSAALGLLQALPLRCPGLSSSQPPVAPQLKNFLNDSKISSPGKQLTNETFSFSCQNEEAHIREEIKISKAKAARWPWFWCFYPS